MKKRILICCLLCFILLLTGCGKEDAWKKIFSASNFKYKDDSIVGEIKNNSTEDYNVKVIFEMKNGDITETDYIKEEINGGEKINIKEYNSDINNNYSISIKNIEYKKRKKLNKSKKIDIDDLEDYFLKIYDSHNLLKIAIQSESGNYSLEVKDYLVQYTKDFKNGDETINSLMILSETENGIEIGESYNADTNELLYVSVKGSEGSKAFDISKGILRRLSFNNNEHIFTGSEILCLGDLEDNDDECFVDDYYVKRQKEASGKLTYSILKTY